MSPLWVSILYLLTVIVLFVVFAVVIGIMNARFCIDNLRVLFAGNRSKAKKFYAAVLKDKKITSTTKSNFCEFARRLVELRAIYATDSLSPAAKYDETLLGFTTILQDFTDLIQAIDIPRLYQHYTQAGGMRAAAPLDARLSEIQ